MNPSRYIWEADVQRQIEVICERYGVRDVSQVKAACIANEWSRIELV